MTSTEEYVVRNSHQSHAKLWDGTSKAYQEGKYTYNDIFNS